MAGLIVLLLADSLLMMRILTRRKILSRRLAHVSNNKVAVKRAAMERKQQFISWMQPMNAPGSASPAAPRLLRYAIVQFDSMNDSSANPTDNSVEGVYLPITELLLPDNNLRGEIPTDDAFDQVWKMERNGLVGTLGSEEGVGGLEMLKF
mmetsp:Transcript_11796/g.25874  ORF Transcript_11796/g.25874 Transcript_11796/m.25874 type:complete len:150 (+) Transcript_11796:3-452(+)